VDLNADAHVEHDPDGALSALPPPHVVVAAKASVVCIVMVTVQGVYPIVDDASQVSSCGAQLSHADRLTAQKQARIYR
jgi:hypothetical protein